MTKRTSISMSQPVYDAAIQKMKHYGYKEFSDYIQALIRADSGFQPALRDTPPFSSVPEVNAEELARLVESEEAKQLDPQEPHGASSAPAPATDPKPSKAQRRKRGPSSRR